MTLGIRFRRSGVTVLLSAVLLLPSCGDPKRPSTPKAATVSGPLSHSAYIWQRDWNDAVRGAVVEHGNAFAELSVLGAQLAWKTGSTAPEVVRPNVHWKTLAATGRSVSASIRIERPGSTQETIDAVAAEAARLEKAAAADGVKLCGFQIDYDSPQSKLGTYASWLGTITDRLKPLPVRITVLASWLGEPDFKTLISTCDGYILQVHSFDRPLPGQRPAVFDPVKTRAWVQQASALGRPFAVALPTYRTTAGYDSSGKLVGVATDSVSPRWTAGTSLEEFPSDPDELSTLVAEWMKERPAALTGVWWYRFPVATDTRNWRWPALSAVMAGRPPASNLEVTFTGEQPVDFVLWNHGEKDEWLPEKVTVNWPHSTRALGDGVSGWDLTISDREAVFSSPASLRKRMLPPGQSVALGWLRFHDPAPVPAALHMNISAPALHDSSKR
jgi:hypothetical protein